MKIKILFLLFAIQSVCFAQPSWKAFGDDDFNRASYGAGTLVGKNPFIVKNNHIFLFFMERGEDPLYNGNLIKRQFSVGKYNGTTWEHYEFPTLFQGYNIPYIDCTVDNNEVPYMFFKDSSINNLLVVKKYQNGNWTNLGTGISTSTSNALQIVVGNDNLPLVLFREDNFIKLKKYDGTNWVLLSQTDEFIPFSSIFMELDNNDVPYIVSKYEVGSNYNCFVKKLVGSNWQEVGITGFSSNVSALDFDNNNVPHMSLGTVIKQFNGTTWNDIITPLATSGFGVNSIYDLAFDNTNALYVSCNATPFMGLNEIYIKKLVGTTWQTHYTGNIGTVPVFTLSGNDLLFAKCSVIDNPYPFIYPDIYKINYGSTNTLIGGTTFSSSITDGTGGSENDYQIPDFSICDGNPWIAYPKGKAQVAIYTNNNWMTFSNVSENNVKRALIKSDALGNIYIAYNNSFSSNSSDTKLTVKKLTSTGWQLVGPANFSQSAGLRFDFRISHANELYVLYMNGRLQKFDGTNWVYVGGSAYTGDRPAQLALDANDIPYIAYKDPSNNSITVKRFIANNWEDVDLTGLRANLTNSINTPKIVLDSLNNIYVAFFDNSNERRLYIRKLINGTWQAFDSSIVFNPSGVVINGLICNYDIALDHDNTLYIAYNEFEDFFRKRVKVKKFNGTSLEFVGEPNFSATSMNYCKLDFTDNNTPMIAYSSQRTYQQINLKYFSESLNPLGINDHQSNSQKWLLAPNPANETFSIIGNNTEIQSLDIYDLTGKKVKSENTNFSVIDVSSFQPGIYFVNIKANNGFTTLKLVKQ